MSDPNDPLRSLFKEAAAAGQSRARSAPPSYITARGERVRRNRTVGLAVAACLVFSGTGAAVVSLLPDSPGTSVPATTPSPRPKPSPSPSIPTPSTSSPASPRTTSPPTSPPRTTAPQTTPPQTTAPRTSPPTHTPTSGDSPSDAPGGPGGQDGPSRSATLPPS
ncbi:hypothetical protein ACFCV8_12170 [Streptomyces sp. NPDC056347]|uniref:hypothetical protein n=1 Tax=Streptomyces sp. NPDC056347 TaxID=3345790 RepID=UPI0035DB5612